jgi:hypothetical protein
MKAFAHETRISTVYKHVWEFLRQYIFTRVMLKWPIEMKYKRMAQKHLL